MSKGGDLRYSDHMIFYIPHLLDDIPALLAQGPIYSVGFLNEYHLVFTEGYHRNDFKNLPHDAAYKTLMMMVGQRSGTNIYAQVLFTAVSEKITRVELFTFLSTDHLIMVTLVIVVLGLCLMASDGVGVALVIATFVIAPMFLLQHLYYAYHQRRLQKMIVGMFGSTVEYLEQNISS